MGDNGGKSGRNKKEDKPKVTICTIHKAKGREWKYVFIPHFNEGYLPSTLREDPKPKPQKHVGEKKQKFAWPDADEIDSHFAEECRLMHVAITRAKRICYVLSLRSWQVGGEEVEGSSIDLDGIDPNDDTLLFDPPKTFRGRGGGNKSYFDHTEDDYRNQSHRNAYHDFFSGYAGSGRGYAGGGEDDYDEFGRPHGDKNASGGYHGDRRGDHFGAAGSSSTFISEDPVVRAEEEDISSSDHPKRFPYREPTNSFAVPDYVTVYDVAKVATKVRKLKLLGIDADSWKQGARELFLPSEEVLQKAYRLRARDIHPDKCLNDRAGATERFKRMGNAYNELIAFMREERERKKDMPKRGTTFGFGGGRPNFNPWQRRW
ncbi:unnamed protein product [Amoebophrya sp. A25]|nr:unnamed protein product [Amoebophrya sp. A25]|eukprot:GSA25T00024741001.1